jgi:hypothetical protein
MGWEPRENKCYYFRYRKVDGRVTRQYLGAGAAAKVAAAADALRRADRRAAAEARRAEEASSAAQARGAVRCAGNRWRNAG